MKNTRVARHGLRKEGKPYRLALCSACLEDNDTRTWQDEHGTRSSNLSGHGLCQCGQVSSHLESDRARRAWITHHKDTVRNA